MQKKKCNHKLICFIGIDGSGKTTIARLLAKDMSAMGIDSYYSYGRYIPIISKPIVLLSKYLFLKGENIKSHKNYTNKRKQAINEHVSLLSLYLNILLIDYRLQLIFKLIIPMKLGKVAICDRYVFDTVINDIPKPSNNLDTIKKIIDQLFNIAPRPDLVFLIDTPIELAYKRKTDTPSLAYLDERKKIYDYLAKEYNMNIIDGTLGIGELMVQIKECVLA